MPTLIASTTHSITHGRTGSECRPGNALRIHQHPKKRSGTRHSDLIWALPTLGSPKSTDFIWSILCRFIVAVRVSPRPQLSVMGIVVGSLGRHEPPICSADCSRPVKPSFTVHPQFPGKSSHPISHPPLLFPIFVPGSFSETNDIFWDGSRRQEGGRERKSK